MTDKDLILFAIEGIRYHLKDIYNYFGEHSIEKSDELQQTVNNLKEWAEKLQKGEVKCTLTTLN